MNTIIKMSSCVNCKFYNKPLFARYPTCTRISNINLKTGKNKPFTSTDARKICKGYFFEHAKSDLFSSADDALSDDSFFSVETVSDGDPPTRH